VLASYPQHAGDALWLSPSYGDDRVGIHFSWQGEPEEVQEVTAEIEAMLLPLGARSRWGKIMHACSSSHRFIQSCQRLGSSPGKSRNEFLDVHVFG
jgi:alditol oxidase